MLASSSEQIDIVRPICVGNQIWKQFPFNGSGGSLTSASSSIKRLLILLASLPVKAVRLILEFST